MKLISHILVLVLFFLAAPFISEAQQKTPPKIEWQKSYGGSDQDRANFIRQTADGGYIIAGVSKSIDGDVTDNNGGDDIWIVKLTPTGSMEWGKSLGGTRADYASCIQQTTDGGYVVAGYTWSSDNDVSMNHGENDYWVVKLSNVGSIQWEKSMGGSNKDEANFIQQTTDGGYIVAGGSRSTDGDVTGNHGGDDFWIIKLTGTGTIEWEKSLGGTATEEASSIEQTDDGGYIIAGSSNSIDGDVIGNKGWFDYWIVKLSSNGVIEWQKSFGGNEADFAYSIQQTVDGGYIVAGLSASTDGDVTDNHGSQDYWVVKLTDTGAIEWKKSLGGSYTDGATSVSQSVDGGYVITGYSQSIDGDITGSHGDNDYWVVKLTKTGNIEWQKSFGGSGVDYSYSIERTSDGGYVTAGFTGSKDDDVTNNHGGSDIWIVKLSPENPSSVESESATTRTATITPNPASSSATLTLESDEAGACEVQIISVTGATLKEYSTHLTAGKQEIALDGLESLPSGMYEVVVKRSGYQMLVTKLIIE